MTLAEAVQIYTVCVRSENKSQRTVDWVEGAVRRLEVFARKPNLAVEDITTDFIRKFSLHLDKEPAFKTHNRNRTLDRPIAPETKANYIRALKSLFSRLTAEGYVTDNPMLKIRTPKVPLRDPQVLTEDELRKFFAAIDKRNPNGFRDHALFLTLLDTGLRVSELCGLTLDDMDLENGYLKVMGKGQKERYVPIGDL